MIGWIDSFFMDTFGLNNPVFCKNHKVGDIFYDKEKNKDPFKVNTLDKIKVIEIKRGYVKYAYGNNYQFKSSMKTSTLLFGWKRRNK